MKILLTGATGTIGRHLVERLSSTGVPLRALVRSREKGAALEKRGIKCFIGDFEKPETFSLRPHQALAL